MRRTIISFAIAASVALVPGLAHAGVSGPAFYVNGELYRTVGTSTDISGTGAPAHSFDAIYEFGGAAAERGDGRAGRSRLQRWPLARPRALVQHELRGNARCS